MRHPLQEPDVVRGRRVGGIAAGVVIATIVGVLVSWGIERYTSGDPNRLRTVKRIPGDVSGIETRPFTVEAQGIEGNLRAEAVLSSYGWVDRHAGVVHVPIEVAFDLYLERRGRKPQGPQGQQPQGQP